MAAVLQVDGFSLLRRGRRFSLPQLTLERGQVAALHGASGSGKTTVLHGLFGLARQDGDVLEGHVAALGRELRSMAAADRQRLLRTSTAWLLQDAQGALDPLQPLGDQIRQATYRSMTDIHAALRDLGIDDAEGLARRLPHQVSGGQAQRVLFAVAALRQPELVIADEPSANLDERSGALVADRLQRLRAQGAAILLATHDARLLAALSAQVLVADAGTFRPGTVPHTAWPLRTPAVQGDTPVLRARGLRVHLGGRELLAGVDLDLHRGEVLALVGDSGAGKTTLARVLAGYRAPDQGTVERPERRGAVQLLGQDAAGSLTPGRTLRSLLAEAHAPFFDAVAAAAGLSLPAAALDRTVAQLSGGECRRAALLRALAVQPDILLLDEPTAALDHATAVAVVSTLLALRSQRGLAMLVITHDVELARAVGDRVLTLSGGRT